MATFFKRALSSWCHSPFCDNDAKEKPAFFFLSLFLLLAIFASFSARAKTPQVSPAFCQNLVKHIPDADVDYRPGVDVYGKPVAPADLPGTNDFQLQQPVTIPLTVDLLKFLNLPAKDFPFNTMGRDDINLGTLTVEGDRVTYNGQPLTDQQQDNLAVLCMKPTRTTVPVKLLPDKP